MLNPRFNFQRLSLRAVFALTAIFMICISAFATNESIESEWEQTGWGGGGYYYAAAFHPSKPGVIYLAGDVAGVYKTEDYGRRYSLQPSTSSALQSRDQ
ncbi:hypothetical protein [Puniceicoccus vermicola]|uniref:Uncharacterized protein n=1 Tax=Puniceicoccus vermicola TaxID=388746 RepID=A0A7X1AZE7_9BACT|nr:hypothetical protein [Puniceicoccus vermicola]MBC2602783.1 hypothetical protein [Puniceicoccus vermicola]